jgi:hypothetical protein
LFERIMVLL